MCGIAGLIAPDGRAHMDVARVQKMLNPMRHRGPDGDGLWSVEGVAFGHLRLSIIDLGGGKQPMQSKDGRLTITFNGEIYNFLDLRRELEAMGHAFRTHSDTEVILAAWAQWGAQSVERLNGMFAFAIHDASDRSVTLVRDRLGVKPLYHARLSDGTVAFASELKGLLALPDLPRAPDMLAVEDYMAFGYVPDHRCILKGVEKLPAGHIWRIAPGETTAPTAYWDLDFSKRHSGSEGDMIDGLRDHLARAVKSRMVSDVPLGAFLSGGVDSSAVVALMAENSSTPVKSCSIGFDQASLDETAYADRIAGQFGCDHRTRRVGSEDYALIDTLVAHFDEPFADASALPTYRVSELAREHVTVALSGDGMDEALAGYRRHVFFHGEERARAMIPAFLRRNLLGPMGRLYPKADWAPRPLRAKTTLLALARSGPEAYAEAVGATPPALRHGLYGTAMARETQGYQAEQIYYDTMAGAPARSGLDAAQYADMKLWLPGDILTKVDRTSMAVSLEAREPLLDYQLLEYCAALPEELRVRGGQGKWAMKKAMEPDLPNDILYRPKMGFVTPIAGWMRGPLADEVRALAKSEQLVDSGWFDAKALTKMADAHISGLSDHSRTLWQLLMLDKSAARLFG
jgi:asparagine synthase (glutamine-hydrolysing)